MAKQPPTNAIDAYVRSVVDGTVPAGKYHRLSCARHLRDRARETANDPAFPFRFDMEKVERFVRFAEKLKHYKGQWAKQFIILQPHQHFRWGSVFGWVHRETGLRRFRNVYNEVPRKNGKSLESAVVTLYVTFFDGENGANGYCAATKREQSLIVFNDCKKLVLSSGLKTRLTVQVSNIYREDTASKLEPLSADYNSMDGLNPNMVTLDELHAMKTRGTIDVLETATGARAQPIINKITTAGDDPVSPCGDEHDYACKILDGVLTDESYFAFIAHSDPGDDWTLPETARKANPNYGVSVNPDDLKGKVLKAISIPAAAASYQQKHLCLWVNTDQPWLSLDGWRKGQSTWALDDMVGQPCWGGIDLSSKIDLTAVALLFPPHKERVKWRIALWAFTPDETLLERERRDRAPYRIWKEQGWLTTTPSRRIDYNAVLDCIEVQRKRFKIQAIGFDPYNAENLEQDLKSECGFGDNQIIEIPQTFLYMSPAAKDFEADVLDEHVDAGNNPLMTWAVSNAVVQVDGKDNIQPIKKRSRGRIDPVVAVIVAKAVHKRLGVTERQPRRPMMTFSPDGWKPALGHASA